MYLLLKNGISSKITQVFMYHKYSRQNLSDQHKIQYPEIKSDEVPQDYVDGGAVLGWRLPQGTDIVPRRRRPVWIKYALRYSYNIVLVCTYTNMGSVGKYDYQRHLAGVYNFKRILSIQ